MASDYDKDQDQRIAANSAAIAELLKYIRELRDHFEPIYGFADKVPEKWHQIVRKLRLLAKLGVLGVVLVKGAVWYVNKQKLHHMADQYAEVARDLYEKENNPEVAMPFLEKAIEIDKDCPEYLFRRAYMQGMAATRTLLNLGRPFTKAELDAAHRAYAEAKYLEQIEPKRAEPFILQGQILSALKDRPRARAAIEKAVSIAPDNAFAHIRMAMVQLDDNDVTNAEKSLDVALKLDPKSKWAWLWKGIVASDYKKDYEETRRCCDKALEIDPKFDMAYYNRGWTFAKGKKKRYDLARAEMVKALRVNPDYKEACYAIGWFYGYEDNYPVAKTWMDKAIALDAKFQTAHFGRGVICGEMGEYDEAIRSFDAAILLDPMNDDLYVRRARMAEKAGRLSDALRDLRFALEIDPKDKRTLMYLGAVYLKAGDPLKAIDYCERAIALDSTYDDAYAHKASALVAVGKTVEALTALDEAIRVTKYKPQRHWMQKAELLEKIGRRDEALACFVKVRTLDPKFAAAWRKEAALQKGRDATAYKQALQKYIELVPTDADARKELHD